MENWATLLDTEMNIFLWKFFFVAFVPVIGHLPPNLCFELFKNISVSSSPIMSAPIPIALKWKKCCKIFFKIIVLSFLTCDDDVKIIKIIVTCNNDTIRIAKYFYWLSHLIDGRWHSQSSLPRSFTMNQSEESIESREGDFNHWEVGFQFDVSLWTSGFSG